MSGLLLKWSVHSYYGTCAYFQRNNKLACYIIHCQHEKANLKYFRTMPQMNAFVTGFLKELTFSEDEFWLTSWAGLVGVLASVLTKHTILSAVINLVLWPLKCSGKSSRMHYITEFIWIRNTIQITCQLIWLPVLAWTRISTAILYWHFGYQNNRC